ncbi:MAG: acyl-CoA dehydrogenase family protein [Gordonia sp. (in: high G+C Gram-positive bacteria)]
MDFALDEQASAVDEVAGEVLGRHESRWESTFGRTGVPVGPGGFDEALWAAMTAAGLGRLALPEVLGGDGLGVSTLTPLLRRLGAAAGVAPAIGSLSSARVLAAVDPATADGGPLLRWGASLARGGWHAIALGEPGDLLTATPATALVGGRLSGVKAGVLHADGAAALLVSTDSGIVVVAPDADGVHLTRTPTSSGWGEYTVRFDDVAVDPADVLVTDPATLRDHYRIALCAYADGLIAGATRLTADHVSGRHQFGKPIALFQAVGQQLADIYVIGRAMTLATTAAAWRLAEGLDAGTDLAIGTYWMGAEIPATLRTMTHLHGGIGVDVTYPLHRYFSIAKDLGRLVGGGPARLDELADAPIAAEV